MEVPVFSQSVVIDAPVDQVFRFHEREDALSLLLPPFPPVRVVSRTGGIRTGARVELQVGFSRWVAVHTGYQRNQFFEDKMVQGPFAQWLHRHEFEPLGGQTRLTDRVSFELPGGALVNRLFGWTVRLGLRNMFAFRHRVTKEFCERRDRFHIVV